MKTKIVVLIGLALCTMLLVSPALASDTSTLEIYGNANEDDTIDMRDLTYVKLIFFGKKPETELADAKYDDKINPLDFIQIKLIIVGKEKELTIIDFANRIVTVKKPVERVITILFGNTMADAMRMLGAKDKIVGVRTSVTKEKIYFPELSKLPSVGSVFNPDIEAILNLEPDVVFMAESKAAKLDEKLPDNIAVVGFDLHYIADIINEEVMKLGYILDKRNEAGEFIDHHNEYIDFIKARTEGLSEEEGTKVYLEWYSTKPYRTYGGKSWDHQKILMAGGKNIFVDLDVSAVYVDPEEVIMRNPDIIIQKQYVSVGNLGYELDDPSLAEAARYAIVSRPELANVGAVKNERVYLVLGPITVGIPYYIGIAYYAKWLYPDLFEDMDPRAIHQEHIDRFCPGLDYNVYEHGVFVYPEPS